MMKVYNARLDSCNFSVEAETEEEARAIIKSKIAEDIDDGLLDYIVERDPTAKPAVYSVSSSCVGSIK